MAINNAPIFTGQPDIQWINAVVTANTTTDLTGGTIYLVFTADATNGGFVQKLKVCAIICPRLRADSNGNTGIVDGTAA